jgi:hypothetical protein
MITEWLMPPKVGAGGHQVSPTMLRTVWRRPLYLGVCDVPQEHSSGKGLARGIPSC